MRPGSCFGSIRGSPNRGEMQSRRWTSFGTPRWDPSGSLRDSPDTPASWSVEGRASVPHPRRIRTGLVRATTSVDTEARPVRKQGTVIQGDDFPARAAHLAFATGQIRTDPSL